jgi:hypothetical protein
VAVGTNGVGVGIRVGDLAAWVTVGVRVGQKEATGT